MPRKRRRTAFLAISETSGISYPPTATRADNVPDPNYPSHKYLRISHTDHSFRSPHRNQSCQTPSHPPSIKHKHTPTFSRFQLRSVHVETNDEIKSPDSRASPVRCSPAHESDPIINPSPPPLLPPTKRSANPRVASAANLTPAPEFVPISTPPTAMVARSLLDAMNKTVPHAPETPDNAPAHSEHQTTPLLLGNSAIRSAQRQLGMTPTSPTSELVPIPGSIERQLRHAQIAARRLCFSADASVSVEESNGREAHPNQQCLENGGGTYARETERNGNPGPVEATQSEYNSRDADEMQGQPHDSTPLNTRRRLSNLSAVTPIPIYFESPLPAGENHDEVPSVRADLKIRTNTPNVCLASGRRGVASPITPQKGIDLQGMEILGDSHRNQTSRVERLDPNAEHPPASCQEEQQDRNISLAKDHIRKDGIPHGAILGTNRGNLITPKEQTHIQGGVGNLVFVGDASKSARNTRTTDDFGAFRNGARPVMGTSDADPANTDFSRVRESENAEEKSRRAVDETVENNCPHDESAPQLLVHQAEKEGNSSPSKHATSPIRPSLFTKANGDPVQLPEMKDLPKRNAGLLQSLFETKSNAVGDLHQRMNDRTPETNPGPREEKSLHTSMFTKGKGNPVQLLTSKNTRTPTPDTTCVPSLFTTGRGVPVSLPSNKKHGNKSTNANISLFCTGKGRPVKISSTNSFKGPNVGNGLLQSVKRTPACPSHLPQAPPFQPLFLTGNGVPKEIPLAQSNLINNFDNVDASPFTNAAPGHVSREPNSLFSTGSGKKLPIKKQTKNINTLAKDIETLFTNGLGKAVGVSEQGPKKDSFLCAPGRVKKLDSALPVRLREKSGSCFPARTPQKLRSGTPLRNSARRDGVMSGLRTTPFKRPRQISRPKRVSNNSESKKLAQGPVPKYDVPALLKNGNISCQNPGHTCFRANSGKGNGVDLKYDSVGGFRRCQDYQFQATSFGNVSCLPAEVITLLNMEGKTIFGVQDCIGWIRKWFPLMSAKPASCVGSDSWARMSYSLAVWKLSRLTDAYGGNEYSFLFACNIVREILRRISYEWHRNMQPHLLRIMRRDSAPASHTVLIVVDIEVEKKQLNLLLSDGWYVAKARIDKVLQERVLRGKIRIGEKIHISGANLQTCSSDARGFFFGDGDELGRSFLSLSANNVQKRLGQPFERLGIQRTSLILNKLQGILNECGACPPVSVVVLRSYPVYFMERTDSRRNGCNGEKMYEFLREEAEYEARANYTERLRQAVASGGGTRKVKSQSDLDDSTPRDVSCIKEVLVCGKSDDAKQEKARKLVRIYNPTEDLQEVLSKEGGQFVMGHLWPKRNAWIGKPDCIRVLKKKGNALHLHEYPRRVYSIHDMQSGKTERGRDFDGVFCLLHVTDGVSQGNHRFVYFIDTTGSQVGILALELNDSDSQSLPKIFRRNVGRMSGLPLVALCDVEFQNVSPMHNLVHARSLMRSSFLSPSMLRQRDKSEELQLALKRLRSELSGKDDQLEVLREAVVSFASGVRASVGAYFTSTQDM